MRLRTAAVAFLAGLSVAVPARAATVDGLFRNTFNHVVYRAAPGERNDLLVSYAGDADSVTVSDPGAVVHARGPCESIDRHRAVCRAARPEVSEHVSDTVAHLGDGADRARTSRPPGTQVGNLRVHAGHGDDVLVTGLGPDLLDGGGGRDTLRAGAGDDTVTDGDTDRTAGPDLVRGGRDGDLVIYPRRHHGVHVDLADRTPNAEGDTVRGFEQATGGSGDDFLAGTAGANVLDGGPGRNTLIGRGGDDLLRFATGRRVACGAGDDAAARPLRTTRVPESCELLRLALPPERRGSAGQEFFRLAPDPQPVAGGTGYVVSCPSSDGEPFPCSLRIAIVERATGDLLASGGVEEQPRGEFPSTQVIVLQMTPRGEQLQASGHRVAAVTEAEGSWLAPAAWSMRF